MISFKRSYFTVKSVKSDFAHWPSAELHVELFIKFFYILSLIIYMKVKVPSTINTIQWYVNMEHTK